MLAIITSRGWISKEDNGINDNYYLYLSIWHWTITPINLWTNNLSCNSRISIYGAIEGNQINPVGGVQSFTKKILYLFSGYNIKILLSVFNWNNL